MLLGDRYDWRPLSEAICAPEFEALLKLLEPGDLAAANAAYSRDGITYLEQKARRIAVATSVGPEGDTVSVHNGALALVDDYNRALAAFPPTI